MAEDRYFSIGLDSSKLLKDAEEAKKAFDGIGKEAEDQGKRIDQVFAGLDLTDSMRSQYDLLNRMSKEAFAEMTESARQMVVSIQDDISSLRNVEQMMKSLNKAYEDGAISQTEYINASARLTVLHEKISKAIEDNERALKNESRQIEVLAEDSMTALQAKVTLLTTEYMKLSEAQRNSAQGDALLKNISEVNSKLQSAQTAMNKYGVAATNTWNGLNVSVQQLARELPSLALGPQMFFLAISNNLPIFTDEIARARKEYQALTAAGKSATPVWKQILSSIFSWQTAMAVGITLSVAYGKQIGEFFQSFFDGKAKIDSAAEALRNINEELESNNENYGQNVASLKLLSDEWRSLTSDSERKQWIVDNKTEFDKLNISINGVSDAENAFVDNTDAIIESLKLRAQAAAAQSLAEKQYEKALLERSKAEEAQLKADKARENKELGITAYSRETRYGTMQTYGELIEERAKSFEHEAKKAIESAEAIEKNADGYFRLAAARKKESEEALKGAGIETPQKKDTTKDITNTLTQQQDSIMEMERKNAEERIKAQQQMEYEVSLARINAMDDGYEKEMALMKLNNERELQEIENQKKEYIRREINAQKEIFDAKEKLKATKDKSYKVKNFDPSGVSVDTSGYDAMYSLIQRRQSNDYNRAQEQAMNDYLTKYGNYWQKRLAIIEKYQSLINKALNPGQKMSYEAEMTKALSDLDVEAQKSTSAIGLLFSDMRDRTVADLRYIANEAQAALDFLTSEEWDKEKGIRFGISEETYKQWKDSPEQLEKIRKGIKDLNREADDSETALNKMKIGFDKLFNSGEKGTKNLEEGLKYIQSGMNDVLQVSGFVSDTLAGLGDAFGSDTLKGIAEGINVATEALNKASQGAQAGSMFGPIGAAAGTAVGLVSSLATSIAKIHDSKNEKRIEKLQDQIDNLTSSYDRLGNAIEKAYSTDAGKLIEQQNDLLEQQKILIEQQIREEEDKKKTDDERIKEWQQQIDEINQTIEDNKTSIIESIAGTDITSAIDSIAQAYADAWTNGEDAAKSSAEAVKSILRTSLLTFLKKELSPDVEEFMAKLADYMADGIISPWEDEQLMNLKDKMDQTAQDYFEDTGKYFQNEAEEDQGQTATAGAFSTMSQESADKLDGRFTALQITGEQINSKIDVSNANLDQIRQSTVEVRDIVQSCYSELVEIRDNTAAIVKPIIQMQKDIAIVKQNTAL